MRQKLTRRLGVLVGVVAVAAGMTMVTATTASAAGPCVWCVQGPTAP